MPFKPTALLILLALPARATPPLPLVDPGVREIQGSVSAASFRDAANGWLITWSTAFRTSDGGRHWSPAPGLSALDGSGRLHLAFTSERTGFAWREGETWILRTSDGGERWSRVELPRRTYWSTIEQVGKRTWLGTDRNELLRSDDAGLTWRTVPGPSDGPILSLSFIDPDNGWATDDRKRLWTTSDGGETWREIPIPEYAEPISATRFTKQQGWIENWRGGFHTSDGGKTWSKLEVSKRESLGDPPRVSRLRLGMITRDVFAPTRVSTVEQAFRAKPLQLVDRTGLVPLADDELLQLPNSYVGQPKVWGNRLLRFERGRRLWMRPLLAPPTGGPEPLVGVGRLSDDLRWGWTEEHVYLSDDGGATWFSHSEPPVGESLVRVAYLSTQWGLAETKGGKLLVNEGQHWKPSTSKDMDAYALARSLGQPAVDPLACLATADEATLDLKTSHFDTHGHPHPQCDLHIAISPTGTALAGEFQRDPIDFGSATTATLRSLFFAIRHAVDPVDPSNTWHGYEQSQLNWTCVENGARSSGSAFFDSQDPRGGRVAFVPLLFSYRPSNSAREPRPQVQRPGDDDPGP